MTVPVPDQLEYISDANGVTKDFPYPKRFLQKDEVVVALRNADGIDTPQILGTHYTIAGSSWPTGGTVSFINAPQAPNKVVRYRMTEAKQTVGLANNQRNDAPSVELQLDRLTMALQDRGARGEITWLALLAEIVARKAGDKQLSDRINAEEAARIAADLLERAQRISVDSAINQRVDKEILDRINGDNALSSLIGAWGPLDRNFYDTKLAASLTFIAPSVSHLFTGGSFAAGDGPIGVWARDNTLTPGGFTSRDGTYWSNISPVMDFLQFGADSTGVEVADQAISDCFARAAEVGAKVQQNSGVFLWRHQNVQVLVDADLTGSTIKLDEESGAFPSTWENEYLFTIAPNSTRIDFDAGVLASLNEPQFKGLMKTGCTYLPHPLFLANRDSFVSIRTSDIDIVRWPNQPIELRDQLVVGFSGMLTWGFDRNLTEATINGGFLYPRERTKRTFKSPTFVIDACGSVCLIDVQRHQTDVWNFDFVEESRPSGDMIRQLTMTRNCYGVNWFGGKSECPDQATAAYTIAGGNAIDVNFFDWYAVDGWGACGLNFIKGWYWHRSELSRIDAHWGMRGHNGAYNCTIKNGRIHIAGGGLFIAQDCTFQIGYGATPNTQPYYECISTRVDYGYEWVGEIRSERSKILLGSEVPDGAIIAVVRAGGNISHDMGRSCILPNVVVKDTVVQGNRNIALTGNGISVGGVTLWDARADSSFGWGCNYPDRIEVDGISFQNFDASAKVRGFGLRANYYGHISVKSRKPAQVDGSVAIQGGTNANVILNNLDSWCSDRISTISSNRSYTLDLRMSQSTWDAGYSSRSSDRWYPRVEIQNSRKVEIIDAFLGEVFISNSEIMKIDDTWGGSPNPRVVIQGGVIKPWYVTAADGLPVMKSDLILLGVGVYAPVKADNTLGTFSLNSAKGMGNFMLSGAKTTNVTGWDPAYGSFWAI